MSAQPRMEKPVLNSLRDHCGRTSGKNASLENGEGCCDMLSSGCDLAVGLMSSQHAYELPKTKPTDHQTPPLAEEILAADDC